MSLTSRTTILIAGVLVLVSLLIMAVGLADMPLRAGGDFNLIAYLMGQIEFERPQVAVSGEPVNQDLVNVVRILFWILLPLSIVYAFVSPQYRRMLLRSAVMILALVLILDRLRPLMANQTPGDESEGVGQALAADAQVLPAPPDFVLSTPAWFVLVVDLLVALVVVLVGWFLWRRFRPREEDVQVQLIETMDSALSALAAGGDTRDVVMRCYADMTTLLARQSRARHHQAMTPRDFEDHLASLGIRDDHIQRLTRLFERVRYGGTQAGPAIEAEARDCLSAIVVAYGPSDGQSAAYGATSLGAAP